MHRIDSTTAVISPPPPEPVGTPGYFSSGVPGTASPATIMTPDWHNDVQENILGPILAAGISPTKGRAEDLLDAILLLIRKQDYVLVEHIEPANVGAGTFTAGDWRTRVLNTKSVDVNNVATLSSNQITLPQGTWRFKISAPGNRVADHVARLWNVTDATLVKMGTSEDTPSSGDYIGSRSVIAGQVVLVGASALEVQHRCAVTTANGLGTPQAWADNIYTQAEFWRVG